MKNISKISMMLLAAMFMFVLQASAQRLKLNVNYSVGVPASKGFSDYVSNSSLRGWNGSLMYELNDQLSLGLAAGSQSFYERYPRGLYKTAGGSDISAVVTNTVSTMPIMARAQFNLLPEARIQPYVGLGVGGNFIIYNQYLGEFSDGRTAFGFAARPEAGISIPVGRYREAAIVLGGAYNYMPFKEGNLTNLNHLGLQAGVKFPLR